MNLPGTALRENEPRVSTRLATCTLQRHVWKPSSKAVGWEPGLWFYFYLSYIKHFTNIPHKPERHVMHNDWKISVLIQIFSEVRKHGPRDQGTQIFLLQASPPHIRELGVIWDLWVWTGQEIKAPAASKLLFWGTSHTRPAILVVRVTNANACWGSGVQMFYPTLGLCIWAL